MNTASFRPAAARLALALAGALTAAGLAAAPANAAEADALPYQKYVTATCANGNPACFVEVGKVAAKQRLEIVSISCYAVVPSSASVNFVALVAERPGKSEFDYVRAQRTSTAGSSAGYVAARDTYFVAAAGDTLRLYLSTTDYAKSLHCKVAGRRVKLG